MAEYDGLTARLVSYPVELSPIIDPTPALALDMERGDLGGVARKDRHSTYRGGSRVGWAKVKDPGWHEREAWRFERR